MNDKLFFFHLSNNMTAIIVCNLKSNNQQLHDNLLTYINYLHECQTIAENDFDCSPIPLPFDENTFLKQLIKTFNLKIKESDLVCVCQDKREQYIERMFYEFNISVRFKATKDDEISCIIFGHHGHVDLHSIIN